MEARTDEKTEQIVARVFGCPAEVARQLLGRGRFRAYERHAVVVRQGDRLAFAWLVIDGRAHALLYSADGQTVFLQDYGPGDLFGALGELDRPAQEADVVAAVRLATLIFDGGEIALLAERHGCIGLALSRMLLRRLRQASSRMYERAALTAVGRVHAELLRLGRDAAAMTIRPAPILSELALRVATTRETASRAVSALERRGIIRRESEALVIVAPRRLEEMVL
ncbi:MAG: Crp/Fnr family transcriptional regulator [Allosphingosinicella sp.]